MLRACLLNSGSGDSTPAPEPTELPDGGVVRTYSDVTAYFNADRVIIATLC